MSFLSFQEFLTYFSKDMTMLAHSGQLEGYLKQYVDFCSKHHIQPTLLELHREYANMHV